MKKGATIVAVAIIGSCGRMTFADVPTPFDAAEQWMSAIHTVDKHALADRTALPFTFLTTDKIKRCEGTVNSPRALSRWIRCFEKSEDLLVQHLKQKTRPAIQTSKTDPSKALQKLAARIRGEGTWIDAFINGDGISFEFKIFVTSFGGEQKVSALLIDHSFCGG